MRLSETVPSLLAEARLAARRLRRRPARSLAIVVVHALGIGAAVALFGLWSALFLRPLPFPTPTASVSVLVTHGPGTGTAAEYSASPIDFVAWRGAGAVVRGGGRHHASRDRSLGRRRARERVGRGRLGVAPAHAGSRPLLGRTFGEGRGPPAGSGRCSGTTSGRAGSPPTRRSWDGRSAWTACRTR